MKNPKKTPSKLLTIDAALRKELAFCKVCGINFQTSLKK